MKVINFFLQKIYRETKKKCSWLDWFFWRWLKRDQKTDWKKTYLYLWKKNRTGLKLVKSYWLKIKYFLWILWALYGKKMFLPFAFPAKNQSQIYSFQNFLVTKYLREGWIKQAFCKEATSGSLYWGGIFSNRLKTLL